jgi:subtilisin family serine protease
MSARLNRSLLRSAAIAALASSTPALAVLDEFALTGLEAPATPLHGTLNPFHGPLAPFHGTLQPFYGNVQPFWGTLSPFHGTLQPFWGTLNPFYADIATGIGGAPALPAVGDYWQRLGNQWQGKESLWTNPLTTGQLQTEFDRMIADGRAFWGTAVNQATGKSFDEGFLDPLLGRNGIDPRNPLTLLALTENNRAKFFMDWYDGLMGYTGVDRVDHWMATANWRPAITQQQGSGTRSIIGLLDGTATGDPDLADNISFSGGHSGSVNGHGVGVASLMVAAHDGKGVMGIAPKATVVAYNPFDATNTASWTAIRQGVLSLAARNASVINMSLGQPGYVLHPTWRSVFFNSEVRAATGGRVFVMAAGNDGVAQTTSMRWDWSRDPNLILVGSVDPSGKISTFSNTPGTACLNDETGCRERLMNRFMVAPGELILLPDGQGGFVRRSGTSFAAPLVAGAITLMHDRWPWLANHPKETVQIMLASAKDLGAPGVDPVYGHGLLDVEASQAPLDFNKLKFYEVKKGVMTLKAAPDVRAAGLQTTWEAEGVYYNLYETVGASFRDFSVPVSSMLVGRVGTLTGGSEYFQRFVEGRMKDWISGKKSSFTEMAEVQLVDTPSLAVTASTNGVRGSHFATFRPQFPRTTMRIANPTAGFGFAIGYGDGALALNGQKGLALASDHDGQGGVNPVLGLASGGAFAAFDAALDSRTTLSFGYTQQRFIPGRTTLLTEAEQGVFAGLDRFEASALNLRLTHRASDSLTLTGAIAQVRETNGLLGVQSREQGDIRGGVTNTFTVTASFDAGAGFTLAASGTAGRTSTDAAGEQGFRVASDVLSTAFAVSATKQGVIGRRDAVRVSLSQPLHIETGALAYRSVSVVDRSTGQLGLADQRFSVAGQSRPVSAEMLYVTPLNALGSELGFFGRADLQPGTQQDVNRFAAGARLNLRFK